MTLEFEKLEKKMSSDWMKELEKQENCHEFSTLVHNYFKLASMRVMQFIRKKYNVPPEDSVTLIVAIFARMLNEGCYAIGANIKPGFGIEDIYTKEHISNLMKVLNGEFLEEFQRTDIDTDVLSGVDNFTEFVRKNATDFYIEDL